jgi:Holliday junction resolvasome RuvABC endonuclease subunit
MAKVIGLDLSLTSTAMVVGTGDAFVLDTGKLRGPERLAFIRDTVLEALPVGCGPVFVEGYSFASKFNREALGELGGVVRVALWEAGVQYVEVPPTTLKMYATGKGNATKTAMVVAARERLGMSELDDNVADALWLHALGVHVLTGEGLVKLPATHLRALDKVSL